MEKKIQIWIFDKCLLHVEKRTHLLINISKNILSQRGLVKLSSSVLTFPTYVHIYNFDNFVYIKT